MSARRWWAWPLVPLYAAALAAKDGLRRVGLLRTRRLAWPVVSVGSLSAGGAGKTPVVIALARLLQERGWSVAVLSRGYGREGHNVERVAFFKEAAARRYGDEPVLLAEKLRVPVWVGADRFAAGAAAETSAAATDVVRGMHLLDDGFQHRQLERTVDVVLVTAEDLDDALLPAGNLRERLGALGRADVLVVREEEYERVVPRIARYLRSGVPIWEIRRQISFPEIAPVVFSEVPTYGHIVFCAIARPENFLKMLYEAGVYGLELVAFPDHHAYTASDMNKLVETFENLVGNGFVTTEKDAVKLSPAMRAQLEAVGPLVVARLDSRFVDEAEVMRALEARIA